MLGVVEKQIVKILEALLAAALLLDLHSLWHFALNDRASNNKPTIRSTSLYQLGCLLIPDDLAFIADKGDCKRSRLRFGEANEKSAWLLTGEQQSGFTTREEAVEPLLIQKLHSLKTKKKKKKSKQQVSFLSLYEE